MGGAGPAGLPLRAQGLTPHYASAPAQRRGRPARVPAAERFGLGPTLFQLPPNLKKDLDRLQSFLALLPNRWPAAFEFRNASWFDDEVYEALRQRDVALCVADTENGETPFVTTGSRGYLRLRREAYDDKELASWAERVAAQPWEEAFVFFKHEDAGAGPALARRFLEAVRATG